MSSAHAPEALESRRAALGERQDVVEFDLKPGAASHSFGEGFSFREGFFWSGEDFAVKKEELGSEGWERRK